MTEPLYSALTASLKMRTESAVSYIKEGRTRLAEIEKELEPLFQRYMAFGQKLRADFNGWAGLGLFHCAWDDYHLDAEQPMTSKAFIYSHNCQDHGYDLSDYEGVSLPFEYLDDPDAFEQKYRTDLVRRELEASRQRDEKEVAELKRLAAKHPDALKEIK